jgi:hypothetical protein
MGKLKTSFISILFPVSHSVWLRPFRCSSKREAPYWRVAERGDEHVFHPCHGRHAARVTPEQARNPSHRHQPKRVRNAAPAEFPYGDLFTKL